MKRTIALPLIIIILLLIAALLPTTSSQDIDLQQSEGLRIFNFNTTTDIEIEETEAFKNPILPGTLIETDIYIKFKFEIPDFFPAFLIGTTLGNWIMFRDTGQEMNAEIYLTVADSPEWCEVKLAQEKITVENFTDEYIDPVQTKLNITIKTGTEALSNGTIKIKANFTSPEKWGFMSSGDELKQTITVGYLPDIKSEIYNTTIQITPLTPNYLPINITNNGNGRTTIKTTIKGTPKNWTISFNESDTELDIGETKVFHLNVTSIKNFDNETIKIEFTPELTQDSDYKGDAVSLDITLQNDGSLKEDGAVDITLLIIILIGILIAIIIAWMIYKRRQ